LKNDVSLKMSSQDNIKTDLTERGIVYVNKT
jgi:hypothetical protein